MTDFLLSLDRSAFLFFNRTLTNPAFDFFFLFITDGRNWILPGIVFAALYAWKKRRESATGLILGTICFAVTDSVTYRILKPVFGRLRPCHPHFFIEGGRFLLGYNKFLSFPSNHAANMFGLATLFTLMYPRRWYWYFPIAAAVAFSRVYVGMHWPLDVVGGAMFGAAAGAVVYYGSRGIVKRFAAHRAKPSAPQAQAPH